MVHSALPSGGFILPFGEVFKGDLVLIFDNKNNDNYRISSIRMRAFY